MITPETKIISKSEVMETLESQIKEDLSQLEQELQLLSHGQKTRLLLAEARYPMEEEMFTEEPLIKAFSTMKRLKDSLVAFGVEITIQHMIDQQTKQQGEPNVEQPKE